MKNKFRTKLAYLILCFFSILFYFIPQIKDAYPNQNQSVVRIVISFENRPEPRCSSGFLIKKESRFFVVMTTHAFHLFEGLVPKHISIAVRSLGNPIKISGYEEIEKLHTRHGENTGEYIDTSVIELSNIELFKQSRKDIEEKFLNYGDLAEADEINNIDNSKIYIYSIYGERKAIIGDINPRVGDQSLLGFKIVSCDPVLNPEGGDSGGLILLKEDSRELILGMILKREGDGSSGYAVDSVRIRKAIDMAMNKKLN